MSYFINQVEEDQCVYLTHEGKMAPVEIVATLYEAKAVLAERGWTRIVVDSTELRSVTAAEFLEFARVLVSGLPHTVRVALVARPEQSRYGRLIEDAARLDAVSVRFFLDADPAITWVKEMNPVEPTQRRPAGQIR